MLTEIVTAPYNPKTPKKYIARQQQGSLSTKLRRYVNKDSAKGGFFMLIGESGSGKTTLMRSLLQEEYGEGVVEVSMSAKHMVERVKESTFISQLHRSVYDAFGACADHPKRLSGFLQFIKHAKKVRQRARKDAHPLVLYITLESKDDLDFDTMVAFARSFGSQATMLSSKTDSCKTILEFSNTAISDYIRRLRPSDQTPFEVNAMTEDEFQEIGKQVLNVSNDEQNMTAPYLKYYHDWIGGHTKILTELSAAQAKRASMCKG